MTKNYVSLHNHTEYSSLDGKGTVDDYVKRAVKLKMPALAITDHGNVCGSHEFYMKCREAEIEPILGSEFYFVPDASSVKDDKDAERFHVTIVARNYKGFEVLSELSTESHKNYYYKPLIDRNLLESIDRQDRKNLVVLSGCAGSIISRKILGGVEGSAHEELLWWKKTFPNFYIELMHHDTPFDRKLNRRLLKAAQRHGLLWVITNDPHFVMKDEDCHHDALLAIQTGADLDDPARFRFEGHGYHLRSRKEIERAFRKYGSEVYVPGMAHSLSIAASCKTRIKAWDKRAWHIPKFPDVDDSQRELRRRAWEGLRARGLDEDPAYVARLKHELREFKKQKMADFLLITADLCDAARDRGIRVGPGRGSVCGTLVGYLIGIHKIDPIRYNLLFERFLNPERPKMPDIDTDFPRSRRSEMFEYAEEKYGAENTMRVGAAQRMRTKRTFKSLASALGIPFQEANKLSASIIEDEDGEAVIPEDLAEAYPQLHEMIHQLKGLRVGMSRHPAGVIIFDPDDPIRKIVPTLWIPNKQAPPNPQKNGERGNFVCQFDLYVAGDMGLLKQDFLGLRTLDTIQECIDLIEQRHGVRIEPDDWVPGEEPGDEKVWKMLRQGKVAGVFQMEGDANQRGIQEIKCDDFESIVSCTSLYRAGPMIAGAPDRFLKNKTDKKIRVAHPSLKKYLKNSWGEMIYQEQMFEILRECAGFSWSRVDDAKTAMARKDPEKMAALKDEAIEGFQVHAGMTAEKAEEVWEQIAAQAAYLFNRSHAVAYSMLTYQTARLKMLYPLEFLAALLRTVEPKNDADKGKREAYMTEALLNEFKIMPPDVNFSDDRFMPYGEDQLLFGLVDVKGVGAKAVEKLMEAKKRKIQKLKKKGKKIPELIFESVDEVAIAVNNKGVVSALAAAGALRSLGVEPDTEKQEELLSWQFTDHLKPFRKKYAKKVKLPGNRDGRCCILGEIVKTEKREAKNGNNFVTWSIRYEPGMEYRVQIWSDADELWSLTKGSIVLVKGKWSAQWRNVGISDANNCKVIQRRITKKTKEAAT